MSQTTFPVQTAWSRSPEPADPVRSAGPLGVEPYGQGTGIVSGVLCCVLGVVSAAFFLPSQSLWLDEIGQLGGLSLGPIEVVRWLAGGATPDLLVPVDRMPPLSYWCGWLWSAAFGLNEPSLRWFGVACTGVATLVMSHAAYRTWGLAAGLAAGMLFALSPNVIGMAVEIRAYPLFLLTSSAVFWALTGLLGEPTDARARRWAIGMGVGGLLAIYTHFFGLILVGSGLLSVLIVRHWRGSSNRPVLAACGPLTILSLGVLPFVAAAVRAGSLGASEGPVTATLTGKVVDLIKLGYRLYAAPPTSLSRWAMAAATVGAVLTVLAALAPKRKGSEASVGLLLTLIAGFGAAFAGRFVLRIDTLAPRYNVWMVPAFLLVASSGLAARSRFARMLGLTGVVLLTAASQYSTLALAVRGESFAHNPHRQVKAIIDRLGVEQVAVIHDAPAWSYDLFISLRHALGREVKQYGFQPQASGAYQLVEMPEHHAALDPTSLPQPYLVVISSRPLRSWDITDYLRRGGSLVAEGHLAGTLGSSPAWRRLDQQSFVSFVAARVDVFQRAH